MGTGAEPYLPSIIAAVSGLIGALIGGLSTFLVQIQRLKHEQDIERAKEVFLERTTSEQRKTEFRRNNWQIEHDSLIEIKRL